MIIKPGEPVEVCRIDGSWLSCVADSEIEPVWTTIDGERHKVHDFPVVWVLLGGDRMPWPASHVRPRYSEAATLVREFHETFGLPVFERTAPMRELRARLTREEAAEASDAILSGDLEATAKELADQIVVAYGTALVLGIDLDAAVRAVHASNMSKMGDAGPLLRGDGKVLKGPNYREPDLSDCILDEPD